jgi:DNA-binding MarR family transcriptional regulator
MDIPIYDPRDDYDYVVVRKPTPQTREQNDPDRSRDQPITPKKEAEQDERSPIHRRLESLKQRAADRHVISPRHPKRERTVQHQQPQEERRRERHHPREVEPRVGRDRLPPIALDLRLRPEEIRTISEVGRFRVISARDLTDTLYRGNSGQAERDLSFLRQKNLVNTDFVNARRDGQNRPVERIQVVTLTPEGKHLLRETGQLRDDQAIYSGLVKPREAEHDTQIYRAYLKEWEQIEKEGGTNPRVVLDFELKSDIQKAIHAKQKAEPDEELDSIKQKVAEEFDLKFVDNSIQIPDVRIEYDLDQGSLSGHSDVEVATAAYHGKHLSAKTQAGFRIYASASDRASLMARIEYDHHMMSEILDL